MAGSRRFWSYSLDLWRGRRSGGVAPPVAPSKGAHPTVDDDFAADRVGGFVGGEEDDRFGDLAGIAEAAGGDLVLDGGGHRFQVGFGQSQFAVERSGDRAGTDGVDPDAAPDQLAGQGAGQRDQAGFGGRIDA